MSRTDELLKALLEKVSTVLVPEEDKYTYEVGKIVKVQDEIGFLSQHEDFINEVPRTIEALIKLYKANSDEADTKKLIVLILETILED